MSSGRKAVRQNTRERVISTDFNRTQSMVAGWNNEAAREQMLAPQDDSFYVGTTFFAPGPVSVAGDILVPSAPDYAGILNGLMVIVPAAATYLLISGGMLVVVDPEGAAGSSDPTALNPDDGPGPSRLVYSAGVTVAGSLSWTPNPGPGTRIDIVEVQRTNVVAETDNRDIFDPATGLFTPAAVTKVIVGDLSYRIRLGAPGGGLPTPALGWVPLAVMATGAGAVNLDAVVVWDVRPLLSDLASPYAQVRSIFPRTERFSFVCERHSTPGQLKLSGESVGAYLGWKIGGIFREPDLTSTPFVNLANAPFYQAAGFVSVAGFPYYVYALWPQGYVRWVRYHNLPVAGVGGRVPGSFRGIITVSQTPPINGQPIAPVALPPAWGLGVSTIFGALVASGTVDGGGLALGFIGDGDMISHEFGLAPWFTVPPSSIVGPIVSYILLPGIHFPAGASRVRAASLVTCTNTNAASLFQAFQTVSVTTTPAGLELAHVLSETSVQGSPGLAMIVGKEFVIPVGQDGISAMPPSEVQHRIDLLAVNAVGPSAPTAAGLIVTGWDMLSGRLRPSHPRVLARRARSRVVAAPSSHVRSASEPRAVADELRRDVWGRAQHRDRDGAPGLQPDARDACGPRRAENANRSDQPHRRLSAPSSGRSRLGLQRPTSSSRGWGRAGVPVKQSDPAAFAPLPAPSGTPMAMAALSPLRQPPPVLRLPPACDVIITDLGEFIVTELGDRLCIGPVP